MDSSYLQFTPLETIRGLVPNCVPQLFMRSLLGTGRSAIGQFLSVPSKPQKSLRKSTRPVFSFLKWRIKPFSKNVQSCWLDAVCCGSKIYRSSSFVLVLALVLFQKKDGIDYQYNYALKNNFEFHSLAELINLCAFDAQLHRLIELDRARVMRTRIMT